LLGKSPVHIARLAIGFAFSGGSGVVTNPQIPQGAIGFAFPEKGAKLDPDSTFAGMIPGSGGRGTLAKPAQRPRDIIVGPGENTLVFSRDFRRSGQRPAG